MTLITVADIALWARCRRQWVATCWSENGARRLPLPQEMTAIANLRECARVGAIAQRVFAPDLVDLTPEAALAESVPAGVWLLGLPDSVDQGASWHQETLHQLQSSSGFVNGLIIEDNLAVTLDCARYHQKTSGWEVYLYRPSTGLRGVYEEEAAAVSFALTKADVPVSGIHVVFLDKKKSLPCESDADNSITQWKELFRESTVTGKAQRGRRSVADRVQEILAAVRGDAAIDDSYQCKQVCRLCAPDTAGRRSRNDVLTLHKGRHLGWELRAKGIEDIREIDATSCRLTPTQLIQKKTLETDRRHVDLQRLEEFLARLRWPLFFLDFEAYSQSIPPFAGLTPYEHTPVIASLHVQNQSGGATECFRFVAEPGRDQRGEFLEWLLFHVGSEGSIVVFSKPFEAAMVRQLAVFSNDPEIHRGLVARMVDLLEPFAEFMVYHPDQRGKVSLKRVLPIYTGTGYENETVRDGMHANLSYMRHADQKMMNDTPRFLQAGATAAEGVSRFLQRRMTSSVDTCAAIREIADYCAMDTLAMVELIKQLQVLADSSRKCLNA